MALQHTVNTLKDLLSKITHDLGKAEHGNKAAAQRVRTLSVKFEKIGKVYRKESISNEKSGKGSKKASKKPAAKKAKPVAKKQPVKAKAKPKAKAAVARPRALSLKRPTARLPIKRAGAR